MKSQPTVRRSQRDREFWHELGWLVLIVAMGLCGIFMEVGK